MTTAAVLRKIGTSVQKLVPSGYSFSLLIFPTGRPGMGSYISTAPRKESAFAMKDAAGKLEREELFPTIESN